MWYFLLRYGTVPLALIGWIGFQMVLKKKSFRELKRDIFATIFLAVVYLMFFYLIFEL